MMGKRNKIGILGGTFNPIHIGHVALAKAAYEQFSLDKIWLMVSKNPPHKAGLNILDASVRAAMVKIAVEEEPYLEFSDFELKREGFIYTADTLTLLDKAYPETEFYFIIGGDSLAYFHKWYQPDIILKKAVILASARTGFESEKVREQIEILKKMYPHGELHMIQLDEIPCASSDIRERLQDGKVVSEMLHPQVEAFIKREHLYNSR